MVVKNIYSFLLTLFLGSNIFAWQEKKVIGFVFTENQEELLPTVVSVFKECVDAIIVIDQGSTDQTQKIVEDTAKPSWQGNEIEPKSLAEGEKSDTASAKQNESRYNQPLHYIYLDKDLPIADTYTVALKEGRLQKGTHFVLLYAHELPTASFVMSGNLKKTVTNLNPGESLYLPIIPITSDYQQYYQEQQASFIGVAFADSEDAAYAVDGDSRVPNGTDGVKWYWQDGFDNGLMVSYDYLFKYYALQACEAVLSNNVQKVSYCNAILQYIETQKNQMSGIIPSFFKWFCNYGSSCKYDNLMIAEKNIELATVSLCKKYGIERFINVRMWSYQWPFVENLDNVVHESMKSQYKQDSFLYTYFFKEATIKKRFFIDIGAHDGLEWSNTYFFERYLGWKGMCIEPLKDAYEKLIKNRSAICVNGCVGDYDGQADFLNVHGAPEQLSGLVDTYHPLHEKRMIREVFQSNGTYTIEKVNVIKLNTLLKQHNVSYVDFISLDTEGSEMKILQAIDFDQVYIRVMTIENNYYGNALREFMASKGFQYITTLYNCDEIYVNTKTHSEL